MKRETFQTTNLILRRSSQERDGEIFFQMLQETGNDDFRMFTGVDCYGSFLYNFEDYFEDHDDRYFYSLFLKSEAERFIGYAGFHRGYSSQDYRSRYEIEFYIAKEYRGFGYAEEAARVLMDAFFHQEIMANSSENSELWAKTLSRNNACIRLLEKLGFQKTGEGTVAEMSDFVDWDDEESCEDLVSEFLYQPSNLKSRVRFPLPALSAEQMNAETVLK